MNRPRHPPARFGLGLIAAIAIGSSWVHADSMFNVNTVADLVDDNTADGICHTSAGTCSLRAAIMQSNHPALGVTIINIPGGTFLITRPIGSDGVDAEDVGNFDLNLPSGPNQTILLGAGANQTIIDGNGLDNVFMINAVRSVTIDGVTIRNGATLTAGGGIHSEGVLTVSHCVIEQNGASIWGGGIYVGVSSGSSLTLVDSTLRSNVAGDGGGIFTSSDVIIHNSVLYENVAADSGGAVYDDGQLIVTDSTISDNAAYNNGGGVYSRTSAFLYSTSIVGNDADHDSDMMGGIGGGLYAEAGSRFVAVNTLLALNTVRDTPIADNCDGTLEVYGMNLFDDIGDCVFSGNGAAAIGAISPGTLGPLQNNGGPTLTHALLDGSEAIDAATAQGCIDESGMPLATDQRGLARVVGDRCDIGAFERGVIIDSIFADGFE